MKDINKYLKLFSIPNFTADDFVELFLALLVKGKRTNFNYSDLIGYLDECKRKGEYPELLNEISFNDNGNNIKSDSLNEAFNNMKVRKAIYTMDFETGNKIYIAESFGYLATNEKYNNYKGSMGDLIIGFTHGKSLKKEMKGSEL